MQDQGSYDGGTVAAQPSLRILQILEAVAAAGVPLSPAEINEHAQVPKPTLHRLIAGLESQGYLSRNLDGRSYLPGPRLRRMMFGTVQSSLTLMPQREVLLRLSQQLGETCNLSVPDSDAMIYADRVETTQALRIALQIGSRVPLHCTSAGKACLSRMPDALFEKYLSVAQLRAYTPKTITDPARLRDEVAIVRARGYAEDAEEFVEGMIAMAVPVSDGEGRLVATVSFHAPKQRLSLEEGRIKLPYVMQAAADLTALL